MMPAFVTVKLYPSTTLIYEIPSSGKLAQSLFFKTLGSADPELAREIHDDPACSGLSAPYAVSRITTGRQYVHGISAAVAPGDHVRLTVKLLRDDLLDPLLRGLASGEFELNRVPVTPMEVKFHRKRYDDLWRDSPIARKVSFRFLTHALIGKAFPPSLSTLLERPIAAWNAWAPEYLKFDEEHLKGLELAAPTSPSWLREGAVRLWHGTQRREYIGYLGQLTYDLRRLDSFSGRILATLARFSEFSGIGTKTTMGFGVVRVSLGVWR